MVYALAMAYVEAAVVIYLRTLYLPDGAVFPLAVLPSWVLRIEIAREAATLVMLLAVAAVAGIDLWDRILMFAVSLGLWDLFYYVWLWLLIRWPPSLLTWDVLFLIPVPWTAPVLAPVIVSVLLITGALLSWRARVPGEAIRSPVASPWLILVGGALVLASFLLDVRLVLHQIQPSGFRWGLFGTGVALAVGGATVALWRRS